MTSSVTLQELLWRNANLALQKIYPAPLLTLWLKVRQVTAPFCNVVDRIVFLRGGRDTFCAVHVSWMCYLKNQPGA